MVEPDFIPCAMLRSIKRLQSGVLDQLVWPDPAKMAGVCALDCVHYVNLILKVLQLTVDYPQQLARVTPTLKHYADLNTRQATALYSICTQSNGASPYVVRSSFHIDRRLSTLTIFQLWGPPGTGKTRVISTTTRCLLEMDNRARVLLAAPSNMAADMIASKIMDAFKPNVMDASM